MEYPTNSELELNLDVVLAEKGWTQAQLAKKMKANRQWINQLVQNKIPNVTMAVVKRLADACDVPMEKMMRAKSKRRK